MYGENFHLIFYVPARPQQTRPDRTDSQKCKIQFQASPAQSSMSTAGITSFSLNELIHEREMLEETIKALNREEYEAVEVDSELDDVAEKIKKLLLMSSSRQPYEAAPELEVVRSKSRQLTLLSGENSCDQIFVAFSELEREEDTRQKLVLIRQIIKADAILCSYGEEEGCKIA